MLTFEIKKTLFDETVEIRSESGALVGELLRDLEGSLRFYQRIG